MKTLARLISEYFALGVIVSAMPNQIANGQTEDANPVMANFNFIKDQINANVPPLLPSLGAMTAFTPTVFYGGANVGMTFFHQYGWYQNFGGMVFFAFDVSVNASGASVGVATLGGLPITISNNLQASSIFGGQLICRLANFVSLGATVPCWYLRPNTTTLGIASMANNGNLVDLSQVNLPGPYALSGQGFYFA